MLELFLSFLNQKQVFGSSVRIPDSFLLLTVSGGIDSVVLADLCHRAGIRFGVAHVNFGLRGSESDADEAFVRQLASTYGVPFHYTHFKTKEVAGEEGISVQMAARQLRYPWFEAVADEFGYDFVATAHHQNDVLETVLLNLVRGTGLAGLRGIPVRQGRIIRPLWFATRPQIYAYLQEQGLRWREDSSNIDDKYLRNHLRHKVIPNLEVMNPNFWGTFQRTIERIRATETLLNTELSRSWEAVADLSVPNQILISPTALLAMPEPAFRLAEWLRPYGFTSEQVWSMMKGLDQPPGQVYRSASHAVWHERLGLLLKPLWAPSAVYVQWPGWPAGEVDVGGQLRLRFRLFDKPDDYHPSNDKQIACFDADTLAFPLIIRTWQLGDRFQPLGLRGRKLVSDLLNDSKVPTSERQQVCVLLAGEGIAWVVGYRIGHPYRIQSQTKQVLEVTLV